MIYRYVFVNPNNGHFELFTPFETDKPLSQENATKFILKNNPIAKRVGCDIFDLYKIACDEGYDMKIYNCSYKSRSSDISNLDPLPRDFDDCELIYGVSGNY